VPEKNGQPGNGEDIIYSITFLSFGEVVAAISLGKPITTEFPHCKIPAVRNLPHFPPPLGLGLDDLVFWGSFLPIPRLKGLDKMIFFCEKTGTRWDCRDNVWILIFHTFPHARHPQDDPTAAK